MHHQMHHCLWALEMSPDRCRYKQRPIRTDYCKNWTIMPGAAENRPWLAWSGFFTNSASPRLAFFLFAATLVRADSPSLRLDDPDAFPSLFAQW
jgi:hypothetical protein